MPPGRRDARLGLFYMHDRILEACWSRQRWMMSCSSEWSKFNYSAQQDTAQSTDAADEGDSAHQRPDAMSQYVQTELLCVQNEYKRAAEAAKADFDKQYPDGPPKAVRKVKDAMPKKDRVKRPPTPYNVRVAVQLTTQPARSLRCTSTACNS
jgi:hypothetical protein